MEKATVTKQGLGLKNKYLSPLLALFFIFLGQSVFAQYDSTKSLQPISAYGNSNKNGDFLGSLGIPRDTFKLKQSDSGRIAYKNGALYVYNGYHWLAPAVYATIDSAIFVTNTHLNDSLARRLTGLFKSNDSIFVVINGAKTFAYKDSTGSGSGSMVYPLAGLALSTGSAWGTSVTDNSTNWNTVINRVLYTDTAAMLTNYKHWAAGYTKNSDTSAMLTNYKHWLQGYLKGTDTAGLSFRINQKLNIADTASMLTNYRHWLGGYTKNSDTASMLTNYRHWLQGYIKASDTSSMLTNYKHWAAGYTKNSDTASMLANYLRKIDTAAMLSPYINATDTTGRWINKRDSNLTYITPTKLKDTATALRALLSTPSLQKVTDVNDTTTKDVIVKTIATNTNIAQAGYYSTVSYSAEALSTNQNFYLYNDAQQTRIYQNGLIDHVDIYMGSIPSNLTSFYIDFWRTNQVTGISYIVDSVSVLSQLDSFTTNHIYFTRPVQVKDGDYTGIHYTGSGAHVAFLQESYKPNWCYYRTSAPSNWSSQNWYAESRFNSSIPVKVFMQAPAVITIGTSLTSSAPNATKLENITNDAVSQSWPGIIEDTLNLRVQNMGISGSVSTTNAARFITDVAAKKPKIAILEGTVNDIRNGTLTSTIVNNFVSMLNTCRDSSIIPVVIKILPCTVCTNTEMYQMDSVAAKLDSLITNIYTNGKIVDPRSVLGQFRSGGGTSNLWDLQPSLTYDGLHLQPAGYLLLAQKVIAQIRPLLSNYTKYEHNQIVHDGIVNTFPSTSGQLALVSQITGGSGTVDTTVIATRDYAKKAADSLDNVNAVSLENPNIGDTLLRVISSGRFQNKSLVADYGLINTPTDSTVKQKVDTMVIATRDRVKQIADSAAIAHGGGTGGGNVYKDVTTQLAHINNIDSNYATTATAAGTTTLTVNSKYQQNFTGTTTQTIVLPSATTLIAGVSYYITNNSTGTLTVNKNGGTLLQTIGAGQTLSVTVTDVSSSAGGWMYENSGTQITFKKVLAINALKIL